MASDVKNKAAFNTNTYTNPAEANDSDSYTYIPPALAVVPRPPSCCTHTLFSHLLSLLKPYKSMKSHASSLTRATHERDRHDIK